MALTQISTDGIKNGTITGSDLATNVDLVDNQKLRLGTGNDLNIFFDGSNSIIREPNSVAGQLIIDGYNGTDIRRGETGEHMIRAIGSGAVELYNNGSKKFETTNTGATVSGDLTIDGSTPELLMKVTADTQSHRIRFFNTADSMVARILGDPSTGNLSLQTGTNGNEEAVKCISNGAVELYHDNSKKVETTSAGVSVTGTLSLPDGDSGETSEGGIKLGASGDLLLYHDGSNSYLKEKGTGDLIIIGKNNIKFLDYGTNETMCKMVSEGAVELYYDNSKKFETTSGGALVTGNFFLNDNGELTLGTGGDFKIFHTGTASKINNSTGTLFIQSDVTSFHGDGGSETMASFTKNGAVELYYDNSVKFETHSGGVNVTGSVNPTGNVALLDNSKLKLGTGDDLKLFHDGTDSRINNSTGALQITGNNDFRLKTNSGQNIFKATGSAVELYFDAGSGSSKKFETTSIGATVTGALHATTTNITTQMFMPDQGQIRLGDSDDLKLYHHGHSTIQNTNSVAALLISSFETHIVNAALTENIARFKQNAEVELYYDNSLKFTTTTNGVSLFGDLRFNNGTWTGESLTGKIQTHSGHMYLQLASTTGFWIFRLSNGTEPAYINSSGTYSGSDERRKKDITTITSAVDTIKKLTGRSFTWKEDNKKSFGVIAQEIEPVLPDLVTTQSVVEGEINNNPYKLVNYAALTGHFIEAIKELSAKIDVLETEVAALKAS